MPQQQGGIADVRALAQRDPKDLSDRELTLVLMDQIRTQTFEGIRAPQEAPAEQEGTIARLLRGLKETTIDPALQIGTDVAASRSMVPSQERSEAQGRLLALPGQIARAPFDMIRRGAASIGSAIEPGTPTSRLTPRGELGMAVTGFAPQPGVSTSQRVNQGLSGMLDIGSAAASMLPAGRALAAGNLARAGGAAMMMPAARIPAEKVEQGDTAGGIGALLGLAAPEATRAIPTPSSPKQSIGFRLPNGEIVEIPTTRGEAGSLAGRGIEPIVRGSRLAGGPLREFDRARTNMLIDDVSTDIVRQVSADTRSVEGAGVGLQRALKQQEQVLAAARPGLDSAEAAAVAAMPEFVPTSLREFAARELKLRQRMLEEVPMPGERAAVRELTALSGDEMASFQRELAQLPTAVRGLVEQGLAQQIGTGARPMSTDVALKLLKLFGERTKSAQESLTPGVQGGTLKRLAGLLREDFDAALRETSPQAANMMNSARRQFATVLDRLNSKSYEKMMGANSEAAAATLQQIDVRDIPRIRAMAGRQKFGAAAARLLESKFQRMSPEGRLPETDLPEFFRADPQLAPATLMSQIEPLLEAGRGRRIYGANTMRSITDFARIVDKVAASSRVGSASVIGHMIDAAATIRSMGPLAAVAGGAVGLAGGAGLGLGAGLLAAASPLAVAGTLNLAARIMVKPKGANILLRMAKSLDNPTQFTFWASRLGEHIDRDDELRALLQESGGQGRQ